MGVDLPEGGRLHLWATEGHLDADPVWFNNQFYGEEERLGSEGLEDVFAPGLFRFPLVEGKPVSLIFSVGQNEGPVPVTKWMEEEREQRQKIVRRARLVRGPLGGALSLAADQFVVSRGDGTSVIAGNPGWAIGAATRSFRFRDFSWPPGDGPRRPD